MPLETHLLTIPEEDESRRDPHAILCTDCIAHSGPKIHLDEGNSTPSTHTCRLGSLMSEPLKRWLNHATGGTRLRREKRDDRAMGLQNVMERCWISTHVDRSGHS